MRRNASGSVRSISGGFSGFIPDPYRQGGRSGNRWHAAPSLTQVGAREGNEVEDGDPDAKVQSRGLPPDGLDDLPEQAAAVLQGDPVGPWARVGGEELAQQMPVAAFDVREVVPAAGGELRGRDVLLGQILRLCVGEYRPVVRATEPRVHDGGGGRRCGGGAGGLARAWSIAPNGSAADA